MIALGIVLVVLAVAVVLAAVFGGGDATASLDLGVVAVDTTVLGVYLLGAATLMVLVAGLWLVSIGVRRGRHRRQELRRARQVVAEREHQEGHEGHAPPQQAPERTAAASEGSTGEAATGEAATTTEPVAPDRGGQPRQRPTTQPPPPDNGGARPEQR